MFSECQSCRRTSPRKQGIRYGITSTPRRRPGRWLLPALLGVLGCGGGPGEADRRNMMVERDIIGRGLRDERVIAAMRNVPRHEFVAERLRRDAYGDFPLPIDCGQTISQPYIVALMTEQARLTPSSRVLEIGTGSGYQAAVLSEVAGEVYTLEIIPQLADQAAVRLKALGYERVQVRAGDGYEGWPDAAPFDAIVVTAAPDRVPPPLIAQVKPGGRLVIPVGRKHDVQHIWVITKNADGTLREENILPVRFVPMTGMIEQPGEHEHGR